MKHFPNILISKSLAAAEEAPKAIVAPETIHKESVQTVQKTVSSVNPIKPAGKFSNIIPSRSFEKPNVHEIKNEKKPWRPSKSYRKHFPQSSRRNDKYYGSKKVSAPIGKNNGAKKGLWKVYGSSQRIYSIPIKRAKL